MWEVRAAAEKMSRMSRSRSSDGGGKSSHHIAAKVTPTVPLDLYLRIRPEDGRSFNLPEASSSAIRRRKQGSAPSTQKWRHAQVVVEHDILLLPVTVGKHWPISEAEKEWGCQLLRARRSSV